MLQPGGTTIIFFLKNAKAVLSAVTVTGVTEGRNRPPTQFSSAASGAGCRAGHKGHGGGGLLHPLQPLTTRSVGRTPDNTLKLSLVRGAQHSLTLGAELAPSTSSVAVEPVPPVSSESAGAPLCPALTWHLRPERKIKQTHVCLFSLSRVSRDSRRAALVIRKLTEACWDRTALSLQRPTFHGPLAEASTVLTPPCSALCHRQPTKPSCRT